MAQPCQKGRCPARADVYDWNTTEYRKGCRRIQCTEAHTLAERRRKEGKAAKAAAEALQKPAEPAQTAPESADPVEERDLASLIRADLEKLGSDHPLAASFSAIALSLANEVQVRSRVPAMSSAAAAKQLVDILERLLPTKSGIGDELEEFLKDLADADDDEAEAR